MSAMVGILVFAALFAAFGLLAPVLTRKRCGGKGDGGGCGSCGNADVCALKEH